MPIAAVAAIASTAAVSAGVIAASTLTTISMVVSVVGVLTKSKELTQLGMGMGLASLGSSLLSSATSAGEAAAGTVAEGASTTAAETAGQAGTSAVEASSATTSAVADPTAGITQHSLDVTAGPVATESAAPALGDGGTSIAQQARGVSGASTVGEAPAAMQTSAVDNPLGAQNITGPATPADAAIQGAQAPTDVNTPFNAADQLPNETAKLARQNAAFQDSKSFFSGAFDWMEKNKTVTAGVMNLAGGALKGLGESQQADRLYDLKQREFANANAQPTIGFTVNKNANVYPNQPKQYAGIVTRARS